LIARETGCEFRGQPAFADPAASLDDDETRFGDRPRPFSPPSDEDYASRFGLEIRERKLLILQERVAPDGGARAARQ